MALHDQNRQLEEKVRQRTIDLEQALANLQRSQQQHIEQERLRALGEMSSGVAMDFNNQLTVLIGYSELLLLNNAQMLNNKAMAVHYLETIHTAAQESATVVSRLREFSRSREAGDIFLAVDLQALVHEVAHLTRPKWREQARAAGRQVQVRLELEPVPAIAGNAAELRDVVTNLIFNAVDAMTQGGTITLRTRREADTVLVEVVGHRHRHERRGAPAVSGAVFHHQGREHRRPRVVDGLRHRQTARRQLGHPNRAGERKHVFAAFSRACHHEPMMACRKSRRCGFPAVAGAVSRRRSADPWTWFVSTCGTTGTRYRRRSAGARGW